MRAARLVLVVALIAVVAMVLAGNDGVDPSGRRLPDATNTVLVTIDGLALDDVGRGSLPATDALASSGAVAATSVRGRYVKPTVGDALTTLAAGGPPSVSPHASLVQAIEAAGETVRVAIVHSPTLGGADDANALRDAFAPAAADALNPPDVPAWLAGRSTDGLDVIHVVVDPASRAADLSRADRVVAAIASSRPNSVAIVASGSGAPGVLRLGAAAMGGGVSGALTSPSTRRTGLVVVTDLAPSLLTILGVPVPAPMVGQAMRSVPETDGLGAARPIADLAVTREHLAGLILGHVVTVGLVMLTFALVAAAAPWRRGRMLATYVVVAGAGAPLADLVLRALTSGPSVRTPLTLTVIAWLVLTIASVRAVDTAATAVAVVCAMTTVAFTVDLAMGADLQAGALLGYSPLAAARFNGIGNAGFGALGASAVVGVGWLATTRGRPSRRGTTIAAVALGLVFLATAAPWAGNDVGGALTFGPVALAWLSATAASNRHRVLRAAIIGGLLAVGVLALVALTGLGGRTQLSSLLERLGSAGGSRDSWAEISRKAENNLNLFRRSSWTHLVIGSLVALAWTRWRGRGGTWSRLEGGQRATLVAAVAIGVLGAAVNDSGVETAGVALFLAACLALAAGLTSPEGPESAPAATDQPGVVPGAEVPTPAPPALQPSAS